MTQSRLILLLLIMVVVLGGVVAYLFNSIPSPQPTISEEGTPPTESSTPETSVLPEVTNNTFTYNKIQTGLQYGGMTAKTITPYSTEYEFSGENIHVEFIGPVTVVGRLSAPTGNPEDGGMGPDYSISNLTKDSLVQIPKEVSDPRHIWFGIENPEVLENAKLKNGDTVEITLRTYTYISFPAGIWNLAEITSAKKVD